MRRPCHSRNVTTLQKWTASVRGEIARSGAARRVPTPDLCPIPRQRSRLLPQLDPHLREAAAQRARAGLEGGVREHTGH